MRGTRPSSAKHPNLTRAETTGSYHQRPFSATAPRQEEDGGQVIERSQVGHLDPEDLAANFLSPVPAKKSSVTMKPSGKGRRVNDAWGKRVSKSKNPGWRTNSLGLKIRQTHLNKHVIVDTRHNCQGSSPNASRRRRKINAGVVPQEFPETLHQAKEQAARKQAAKQKEASEQLAQNELKESLAALTRAFPNIQPQDVSKAVKQAAAAGTASVSNS